MAPAQGCRSGIGPRNFRLPSSAMRMTIVAYTSGEAAKVKTVYATPNKPLSSVERDDGQLCPISVIPHGRREVQEGAFQGLSRSG